MRSIGDVEVANKKIIIRVDLNLPMIDGKIIDYTRFDKTIPTIKYLLKNKAKVIIISHLGRPKGGYEEKLSLKFLVNEFKNSIIDKNIEFANSIKDAREKIKKNDLLILENLRFNPQEEKNCLNFAKKLASIGEIYVNEAFSCSHRSHSSIDAITKFLPSFGGFLLLDEIRNLSSLFNNNKSLTAIVGGSKISTKLDLLTSLINKANNIIIGGAMANNFLKANSINIGKSLYEKNMLDKAQSIMCEAKEKNCNIILPIDAKIAKELGENFSEVDINNITSEYSIFDIGNKTVNLFSKVVMNSNIVIWNGPMGVFEYPPFDQGTNMLAKKIAELTNLGNLTSVAGGGDIVAALNKANLNSSFSYISTAGGAFLEWLEGKELPGIKALH